MRNLKKVLSLVLALAMALSLMTVALAADKSDFADADEITYTEAVDVLQALGILGGDDSGNFNPTGVLTREGATKIICYLLMGSVAADKLVATSAPFDDVPANRWSAGYIAYCKTQGIIGGDGTGNFNPNGEISPYGFAKMLLVALGYDANIEKFGGSDWTINVARLANTNGLFNGNNSMVGTGTMTREEASLYAFNALKADMVEYTNKGVEITQPDGSTIVLNPSAASKVANAASADYAGRDGNGAKAKDEVMQLCEMYFKDLKLTEGGADNFGRPSNSWKLNNKVIGNYSKTADLTYTEAVSGDDIWNDLGRPAGTTAVNYYENSKTKGTTPTGFSIAPDDKDKIGGNGALIQVYFTAGETTNTATVVRVDTFAGEVSKVTPAKGNDPATVTVDGMTYESTAYEVEEIVLYTKADGEIQSMSRPDVVTGKVTSTATDTKGVETFVLNGTTYHWSAKPTTGHDSVNVDSEYDLYLDQYGYVIYADETKGNPAQYGVVIAAQTGGWVGSQATYTYKLVLADGTVAEVVSKDDVDFENNREGVLVEYSVKNDEYKLTKVETGTSDSLSANSTITRGKAELKTGLYANSKTVFIVRDGKDGDYTYTAYTGIANMPDMTGVTASIYKDGTVAKLVYITAGEYKDADDRSIYVVADKYSTVSDANGKYNVYNAVIDGEITTIRVDSTDASTIMANGSALYSAVYYDKDGNVTGLGDKVSGDKVAEATGKITVKDGLLTVGGVTKSYVDNVPVFVIAKDGDKIESSSLTGLDKDATYAFTFALDKNDVVTAVYAWEK